MAMRKYTQSEQMNLFTDAEKEVTKDHLKRLGKTSAKDLDQTERDDLQKRLNDLNLPQ